MVGAAVVSPHTQLDRMTTLARCCVVLLVSAGHAHALCLYSVVVQSMACHFAVTAYVSLLRLSHRVGGTGLLDLRIRYDVCAELHCSPSYVFASSDRFCADPDVYVSQGTGTGGRLWPL